MVDRWILVIGLAASLVSLTISFPVKASPRDEVMSGAFHCAAIGESRLWLNCFYGAAQPEREALGLTPAPAAQIELVLSPVRGEAPPVDIVVRNGILSAAFQCNQLTDDLRWLDCYYEASQPMRASLGLTPAIGTGMVIKEGENMFAGSATPTGTESRTQRDSSGQIESRMVSYRFDRYGIFSAILANGEVWQQESGDASRANWKKPAASYSVLITQGFMGSHNFRVIGIPSMFKVVREK